MNCTLEKIRKDGKERREIERMKGHEWVRVVEVEYLINYDAEMRVEES